jgi:hypothetical protein
MAQHGRKRTDHNLVLALACGSKDSASPPHRSMRRVSRSSACSSAANRKSVPANAVLNFEVELLAVGE